MVRAVSYGNFQTLGILACRQNDVEGCADGRKFYALAAVATIENNVIDTRSRGFAAYDFVGFGVAVEVA